MGACEGMFLFVRMCIYGAFSCPVDGTALGVSRLNIPAYMGEFVEFGHNHLNFAEEPM